MRSEREQEEGKKVPFPPLKYLVPFHHSILFQVPLLFVRLLILSSVKSVLFFLPSPPFFTWSRDGKTKTLY